MADIKVAVVPFTLNAVTGLQEITRSGLGWTPKAIKIELGASTGVRATPNDHIEYAIGASDGTRQWCVAVFNESDGSVGTTNTGRYSNNTHIIRVIGGSSGPATQIQALAVGNGLGSNPGPIANGWRINLIDTNGSARKAVATFYGGADLEVEANNTGDITTGTSSHTLAGSFTPDLIQFFTVGAPLSTTNNAFAVLSRGVAWNNGGTYVNRVLAWRMDEGAVVGDSYQEIRTDSCLIQPEHSFDPWYASASNFGSGSYDIVNEGLGNPNNDEACVLAFSVGSGDIWLGDITPPASAASDWTVNAPGFQPVAVEISVHALTSTGFTQDSKAICFGTIFSDDTDEACLVSLNEDGADPINSGEYYADDLAYIRNASDSSTLYDMSSLAFNANGWTVVAANITTADSTNHLWFGIAFGAGGVVSISPDKITVGVVLDQPVLTAETTVIPDDVTVQPSLDQPVLTAESPIAPDDVTVATSLDEPVNTAETPLVPADITIQPSLDQPSVDTEATISPVDITIQPSLDQPVLTAESPLQPNDLTIAISLDQPVLASDSLIQPNDLSIGLNLDQPILDSSTVLQPGDILVALAVDPAVVTAENPISPNNITVAVALDATTVAPLEVEVSPDDLSIAVALDQPTVTPVGATQFLTGSRAVYLVGKARAIYLDS